MRFEPKSKQELYVVDSHKALAASSQEFTAATLSKCLIQPENQPSSENSSGSTKGLSLAGVDVALVGPTGLTGRWVLVCHQ